ncbi:hypothetical protein DFP74_3571 [Nocardiopsis sp. Huas11]|uniref:hypothetical protein n=1 Tax=Nocardiopsis sp. Huas11 TaxID=2183912 RepID=UPI000EB564D5|nr:hypothetical protein [Nocardiopsis sp. Huas11]RKS07885.1 hypothetical protein DFP74_3571 [Nocardiopsis sp. Huas11]
MSRAATFARLTAFDARRMAVNPLLWIGVTVAVFSYAWPSYWEPAAPTLTEYHASLEGTAAVIAVTTAAVVVFPVMREVGHSRRTVAALGPTGRLLAVSTAAVLLTTAIMAAAALLHPLMWSAPPAGTLSPYAHPTPFLIAGAGPLASIAVVAWTRSYMPLVALGLAVPALFLYQYSIVDLGLGTAVYQISRLTDLAQSPFTVRGPAVTPLAALQLTYTLLVTALLIAVIAAARSRPAQRRALLAAAAALLAGVAGTVGYGRLAYPHGTSFPDTAIHGATAQQCQVRDGITYCPLPGYEAWVDEWHDTIGPSLALLPEAARDDLPVIWQDGDSFNREMDVRLDDSVTMFEYLETGEPYMRASLVGSASLAALGLGEYAWEWCQGTGQSRFVIAAWLASTVQGVPATDRLEAAATLSSEYSPSLPDLVLLRALIEDVPRERMADTLAEHWVPLSTREGTTLELAELVGVSVTGNADVPAMPTDWVRVFPELDPEMHMVWSEGPTCV